MRLDTFIALFFCVGVFAEEPLDCNNAWTTVQINQCMNKELIAAETLMEQYLAKSISRYTQDPTSVSSINKSQMIWLDYRQAHCGAVFNTWREGTIRTAMSVDCKIKLTQQRTHSLWTSFLTFEDSTPALLPEPQK
ncbi:lysozyme inhibitor LprI family protein [Pseudoalteromonas sp. T1lg23B]|uniref:lysozyme inhibitor LprI family protein n=1 Tax=Pseudoalteromonas sp. T1lg23B TaxID=2077097 RepID=UPI000CF6FD58|nr:lysozyme inhibitor LprI family protein [Pseudoalteromonas sp. T1lg23B]